ncbi:MAG: AMP-binding protein, partial [Acidobacteria bacterium]|nr:AMP-binding protein [Acidobacteriota bacterium]
MPGETRIALPMEQHAAAFTELLRSAAAAALGVPASRLDSGRPLTALGLDSLSAVELKQEVESRTGLRVALSDLLAGISLEELAAGLAAGGGKATAADAGLPAVAGAEHPLSYGQRALWFLSRREPDSAAYNLAAAAAIRSPLDAGALGRALQALVLRHAALRTTFGQRQGEPFQRIHESAEIDFRCERAAGVSDDELRPRLCAEAFRPFDLAAGPLLRVRIWETAPDRHVLLWVVHHVAADFTSMAVLLRDLDRLYRAAAGTGKDPGDLCHGLPPVAWTYPDYVRRQALHLAGEAGERSWRYWRERLAGELSPLALPTDRPRPPALSDRGGAVALRLGPDTVDRLRELGRRHRATLYTVLVAAFQTLLHRHAGQLDVAVGSPAAGRAERRFAELVGYCVQPVVLRADFAGDPLAADLLDSTRDAVAGALEHQDFPLPLLVERLQPERAADRSPLFQATLVLYPGRPGRGPLAGLAALAAGDAGARLELGGLALAAFPLGEWRAQFDLALAVAETSEGLLAALQFSRDLFDPETIARMLGRLQVLLAGLGEDASRPVGELPLLTAAERRQLLAWNAPPAAAPGGCLHELFGEQAARTPDAVAASQWRTEGGASLTYAELARRASRLARSLRALGVGPEVLVGLCAERAPAMVVGILGILEAGGAYVPLDPADPAARLRALLGDTRAPVVVAQAALLDRLPAGNHRVVVLEAEAAAAAGAGEDGAAAPAPPGPPPAPALPENPAY